MAKLSDPDKVLLSREKLVAAAGAVPTPANIGIAFIGGIGQLTAALYRKGLMINFQSVSNDGTITFVDVQSRDAISINGVCTGSGGADITVDVHTSPTTPQHFNTGFIIGGYVVL